MRIALVALILIGLCPCVGAKTIFVNNITGVDTNSGMLPEIAAGERGPVRSITRALLMTTRGDKVQLADTGEPYRECVTLEGARNSGYSFAPFVLDGNGATLDGTMAIPGVRWEFVGQNIFRFAPERGGFQMLFLDDQPAKQMPGFHHSLLTSHLQAKEWCRCQGGIHFAVEKGKSPDNYDLSYAKERVGVTLYDVDHVVIQNLTIRGYQLDGINAHDNAMDCVISQVQAKSNGRSGISINGASRLRVINTEAYGNAETQLRCADWSTTKVVASDFYHESRPAWTRSVNRFGRGARLFIDQKPQTELQWWQKSSGKLANPDGDPSPASAPAGQEADLDSEEPENRVAPNDAPAADGLEQPDELMLEEPNLEEPNQDESTSDEPVSDEFDLDNGSVDDSNPFDGFGADPGSGDSGGDPNDDPFGDF